MHKKIGPIETTPTLMLVVPIEVTFDHIKSSYNTWWWSKRTDYLVKKDHPLFGPINLIWVDG